MTSESSKYCHLAYPYCGGNGCDIGSGGSDPVVPWAIQVELPPDAFFVYNQRQIPATVEWRGTALDLPFKDGTLDFVYSSHLLEDFSDWDPLLKEWARVLKPGGHLIIVCPEKNLWAAALAAGQPPNCAHLHEPIVGEISLACAPWGLETVTDGLTNVYRGDYSLIYVGRKL